MAEKKRTHCHYSKQNHFGMCTRLEALKNELPVVIVSMEDYRLVKPCNQGYNSTWIISHVEKEMLGGSKIKISM